ncbi:SDR family NAD(P)-dependent oxidoreductase [Bordetella sp. 15P40C-2]|uniref:SDR family NAD(P)-dependent oxidoreductase n=1 Tax=Bordetella sp. 15P40C-2 TaxID=2572246 RepID=UPI00192198BF|nr:SDR family oxidoreductase [Bordetella sp. 15P40C-2]
MRLQDKVAFVTGAGSGIGQAIVQQYAQQGAAVAVIEKNAENGRKTADAINAAGGRALFIETDVTDEKQVAHAVAETVRTFGKLDILVNNAGGSLPQDGPVTEVDNDTFWKTINLDLFGTWLCCRYAVPEIVAAGGGSVINIVSFYGLVGSPSRSAYSTAKGGVIALTRTMAVDYAPKNIRVNGIAPGTTLTERSRKLVDTIPALGVLKGQHLLGLLEPEDIAHTAVYLGADESARTTGQIFSIDSGLTAQ